MEKTAAERFEEAIAGQAPAPKRIKITIEGHEPEPIIIEGTMFVCWVYNGDDALIGSAYGANDFMVDAAEQILDKVVENDPIIGMLSKALMQ